MLLHSNPLFSIYFGNAEDELDPDRYLHYPSDVQLLSIEPYKKLKKTMQLKRVLFLHQMHSAQGVVVKGDAIKPFKQEGDFLITQEKHVGLGVMTADCLPIIIYDNLHHVVAIIHAGWKSAVKEIAPKVVEKMQELYGTKVEHLRIYFGPSAKKCCYGITQDFLQHLDAFSFIDEIVHKEEDGLKFDLPGLNRLQLEDLGVPKEAFKMEYNFCTICDKRYCSYRRDNSSTCRQMTVVELK